VSDIERRVRVATAADAAGVQAIYAPVVRDTAISFEEEPPSVEEMAGRISATLPTHPWYVAEEGGVLLGYAYAGRHAERAAYRWSANATIYVAAEARGGGVGRSLYAALFDALIRQGFHAAFAGITLPNAASVGLHEAMGFRHLGTYAEVGFKFGSWHDVGYWRRPLAEQITGEPIPFATLSLR
jgi:phosphinothricin acetyltransferase